MCVVCVGVCVVHVGVWALRAWWLPLSLGVFWRMAESRSERQAAAHARAAPEGRRPQFVLRQLRGGGGGSVEEGKKRGVGVENVGCVAGRAGDWGCVDQATSWLGHKL